MNEELFIKVNKKRGLALRKAEKDMEMLLIEGVNRVNTDCDMVKNILTRINLKKASARGFNHNLPFNEDDFSLVEKTFNDIKNDTLVNIICSLILRRGHIEYAASRSAEISFTRNVLECLDKVKKYDNKIDRLITKIKREEFSEDIGFAIYLIKGILPFILKKIKRIGVLFVQF